IVLPVDLQRWNYLVDRLELKPFRPGKHLQESRSQHSERRRATGLGQHTKSIAAGLMLLLYMLSWPAETAGAGLAGLLKYLSVVEHFSEMVKGVIDTRDLVYFLTLIFLSLFLTHRAVEASRWR
ncbi:MAG: hypothetical protein HYU47_05735, partial [Deltaproteobacteria bacterium]|nr:hypothetical protein [Deltaproteobacteria bacterium]